MGGRRRGATANATTRVLDMGGACVLDRTRRAHPDRPDAGGHRRPHLYHGSWRRCLPDPLRRCGIGDRRAGRTSLADGVDTWRHPRRRAVLGFGTIRRPRRTGTRHPRQPGRPRRYLECRVGTAFADNHVRVGRHHCPGRRSGVWDSDAAAQAQNRAAVDTGGGEPAVSGGDGNRSGSDGVSRGGRGGAGPGCASRRAEVGGIGGTGLRVGRCRGGCHVAPLDAARSECGGVRRCVDRRTARPRLGCRRNSCSRALSPGLGGGGSQDQHRSAGCRCAATGNHAAVRMVGFGTGTGSVTPVGSRRCALHRRPRRVRAHRAW